MKSYIGTKAVNAKPMTRASYNNLRGWPVPLDENGDDEGYLVEYTDGGKPNHPDFAGYVSWSPKAQFEGAYKETSGLTFGLALEAMKAGKRVARAGWNGTGLWLEYHQPMHNVDLPYVRLSYPVRSAAHPNGARVSWAPSQTDMLSADWMVLP
jgi:hypothetical protein